jgi:hypothetical protein
MALWGLWEDGIFYTQRKGGLVEPAPLTLCQRGVGEDNGIFFFVFYFPVSPFLAHSCLRVSLVSFVA